MHDNILSLVDLFVSGLKFEGQTNNRRNLIINLQLRIVEVTKKCASKLNWLARTHNFFRVLDTVWALKQCHSL